MKSILIIGIGRFGKHLTKYFSELGNEIMIVDKDEKKVNELLGEVTGAQIGDCMDEKVLRSLGVNNFDICFVCIGGSFQASLEITSLLKDLGAKYVIAKADREIHEKFLLRNGADEVIHMERDVAFRTAKKYSATNLFEYFELSEDYSIIEAAIPKSWIDKSIKELNIRSVYNVNIIAIRDGEKLIPAVDAEHVLSADEHIIIAGDTKVCTRLLKLK
jgi:trk system potassium uptake protein TrkA